MVTESSLTILEQLFRIPKEVKNAGIYNMTGGEGR